MGPATGSSGQYPLHMVGRLMEIRRRLTMKVMLTGTAVYGTVCTVVWEDGGSNPASYPIVPVTGLVDTTLRRTEF